jgi:hypothetical protein
MEIEMQNQSYPQEVREKTFRQEKQNKKRNLDSDRIDISPKTDF